MSIFGVDVCNRSLLLWKMELNEIERRSSQSQNFSSRTMFVVCRKW